MTVRQPMGGGLDVGIVTGRPMVSREEREIQETLKDMKTLKDVAQLESDLPGILPTMASLLERKLLELANANEYCQAIFQQAKAYGLKLNLGQHVATKIRKQAFGVVLTSMTDETKVAPEGIPTED